MTPGAPDRRQHPRVTLPGPIPARLLTGQDGHVLDVSAGGLRLAHEGLVQVGDACPFQLTLNDEPFTFTGRVVWTRTVGWAPNGRRRFESGVVFETIPARAQPLLAHLLAPPGEEQP